MPYKLRTRNTYNAPPALQRILRGDISRARVINKDPHGYQATSEPKMKIGNGSGKSHSDGAGYREECDFYKRTMREKKGCRTNRTKRNHMFASKQIGNYARMPYILYSQYVQRSSGSPANPERRRLASESNQQRPPSRSRNLSAKDADRRRIQKQPQRWGRIPRGIQRLQANNAGEKRVLYE